MFLLANVGSLHGDGGDVKGAAGAIRLCIQLGRGIFIIFRERHVKKCSRSHQEWSRGYKNSRKADVCCRFGPSSGRGPKSAIAEISTGGRARGAPEIGNCRNQHRGRARGAPEIGNCRNQHRGQGVRTKTLVHRVMLQPQGFSGKLPDLLPVFYPDLEKEFSEVRSGSEIGRKSHFCPRTLQSQAFSAEASQTMKQSTLRPKSAIAEISTGGRARGAPEIGNCRN